MLGFESGSAIYGEPADSAAAANLHVAPLKKFAEAAPLDGDTASRERGSRAALEL